MLNKNYSAFVGLHVHFLIHALTTWKKLRFNIFIKQVSLENDETHQCYNLYQTKIATQN